LSISASLPPVSKTTAILVGKFAAGVIDTGGETWLANTFGNFRKTWNDPIVILKAWGKMIHEKNLKQKILWHCPIKAKHQHTQECADVTSWNFIEILKVLSLETIPLKSRVNGSLKRNIQEFIFQCRVFTKSIISHLSF
jgi:hypothetical protein